MSRLRLYTTLGCHLCERLETELARLGVAGIELERIEIADDEALIARYGVRIPVLVDTAGKELERGFEAERLATWLDQRGLLGRQAEAKCERPNASLPGVREIRGRRFLG